MMGFRSALLAGSLALTLIALPVQAKDRVDPASIAAMVEKAKANDPSADVTWLRRENSRSMSYMAPLWKEGGKAFDALDVDAVKALEMAKQQLLLNPLDFDANFVAEMAYDKLGRKDEQTQQHNLLTALLQSVMAGNNGQTPQTAWNAVSVDEEYQVLRLIGFQVERQALVRDAGKTFDAMTVTSRKSGKEITIHFNIDFFFGKQFEGLGL